MKKEKGLETYRSGAVTCLRTLEAHLWSQSQHQRGR
jgi:hypothetical protein